MTTSIVFKDLNYGVGGNLGETDISYDYFFPSSTGDNSGYEDHFIDPSASVLALQNIRYLKTRETGDEIVVPDTTGRDRNEIVIENNYEYERMKMRRKYQVLQHNNLTNKSKRETYASIVRNSNLTNNRIKEIIRENIIVNDNYIINPAINSGVKNDNTKLYLDNNVKFYSNI